MFKYKTQKIKIKNDLLRNLLNHIIEISKLGKDLNTKLVINNNNIYIYSLIEVGRTYIAYKNVVLNTNDYFGDDVENEFHLIILKPTEFKKLFEQLDNDNIELIFTLTQAEPYFVNMVTATDGDLTLKYNGGMKTLMKEIPLQSYINQTENDEPKLQIDLCEDQLKKIQNLNKTKNSNSEDKLSDVVSVEIRDGVVYFRDSRYEIKLINTDLLDDVFYFKKVFLTKNKTKNISLKFYDRFLLIEDDVYNILVVLEIVNI